MFQKIFYWLFLIFLAYVIFELIRTILGGSLGLEALIITFVVANVGYSFYLTNSVHKSISEIDSKISGHIGWHKGQDSKKQP